jgi:hypothetical protein
MNHFYRRLSSIPVPVISCKILHPRFVSIKYLQNDERSAEKFIIDEIMEIAEVSSIVFSLSRNDIAVEHHHISCGEISYKCFLVFSDKHLVYECRNKVLFALSYGSVVRFVMHIMITHLCSRYKTTDFQICSESDSRKIYTLKTAV